MQKEIGSIIILSGGFDPVHSGHIKMIEAASEGGYNHVSILLNSDDWLARKKGRPFMPFQEREYVMNNIKGVSYVGPVDDSDGTVVKGIAEIKQWCMGAEIYVPIFFGNGGDRTKDSTPSAEQKYCEENNIGLLFNLGGGKTAASSTFLKNWEQYKERAPVTM